MLPHWLTRWLVYLGPFLGLGVVVLLFMIGDFAGGSDSQSFLTPYRVRSMSANAAIVAVAGLGMTIIILAGGIDLSAGTMLALASVVVAVGLERDWAWPLALAGGAATGVVCGAVNGVVISKGRIVPFIVTLGTMLVWQGAAKIAADETTVRPNVVEQVPRWLPKLLSPTADNAVFGLPAGVWIALCLAVITALVISKTVFGRHVTAIGSNEQAARLSGLPVDRIKIAVYAIGGFFFGIAGIYLFALMSIGDPTEGLGMELDVIAAVIIGGGSLAGGRASIAGTLAGAAIMSVIKSGCDSLNYSNPTQEIALGVIIVVAVAIDGLRQRRSRA